MENATKALLIAAATLIAIVIIAMGVLIIRNTSNTIKQSDEVGKSISSSIGNAIGSISGKKYTTKQDLIRTLFQISDNYHINNNINNNLYRVLMNENTKVRDKLEEKTYIYNFSGTTVQGQLAEIIQTYGPIPSFNENNAKPYYDYYIKNIGQTFINENLVTSIKDPLDFDNVQANLWNVYKKNNSLATQQAFDSLLKECITALEYDDEGYVKGVYFVYCVDF